MVVGDVPRVPRRARPAGGCARHRDARAPRRGPGVRDGGAGRTTTPPTTSSAAMCAIVRAGLEAGALGFSTGRTAGHRDVRGNPVPGHLRAGGRARRPPGGHGRGRRRRVRGGAGGGRRRDHRRRRGGHGAGARMAGAPGRGQRPPDHVPGDGAGPRSTTGARGSTRPGEANARGAKLRPQVGNRCFGVLMGHQSRLNPFQYRPTYQASSPTSRSPSGCGACASPRSAPGSSPRRPTSAARSSWTRSAAAPSTTSSSLGRRARLRADRRTRASGPSPARRRRPVGGRLRRHARAPTAASSCCGRCSTTATTATTGCST